MKKGLFWPFWLFIKYGFYPLYYFIRSIMRFHEIVCRSKLYSFFRIFLIPKVCEEYDRDGFNIGIFFHSFQYFKTTHFWENNI